MNQFALVIYLPDPLGRFLDLLRCEVVPSCVPHAHVTILPPRILPAHPSLACDALRERLRDAAPFELEAGEVEIFAATDVIYIGLTKGVEQLRSLHDTLNSGPLWYDEPFPYHPHITVAQELAPDQVQPLHRLVSKKWAEFRGARSFTAQTAAFVRNTDANVWMDLEEFTLGAVAA